MPIGKVTGETNKSLLPLLLGFLSKMKPEWEIFFCRGKFCWCLATDYVTNNRSPGDRLLTLGCPFNVVGVAERHGRHGSGRLSSRPFHIAVPRRSYCRLAFRILFMGLSSAVGKKGCRFRIIKAVSLGRASSCQSYTVNSLHNLTNPDSTCSFACLETCLLIIIARNLSCGSNSKLLNESS